MGFNHGSRFSHMWNGKSAQLPKPLLLNFSINSRVSSPLTCDRLRDENSEIHWHRPLRKLRDTRGEWTANPIQIDFIKFNTRRGGPFIPTERETDKRPKWFRWNAQDEAFWVGNRRFFSPNGEDSQSVSQPASQTESFPVETGSRGADIIK